jgi:ferredoxin-type protein NapG
MEKKLTRRQFFRMGPLEVFRESASPDTSNSESPVAAMLLRPPGALVDDNQFLDACERCGACSEACEPGAIFIAGAAEGDGEGTPFMNYEKAPCRLCEGFPCITACPSGALIRNSSGEVAAFAKAEFVEENCLNSQGIICDDCYHHCPVTPRAIRMVGRTPVFDTDACIGCGHCSFICDAESVAIRIVRA